MQRPTCTNTRIATTDDAHRIFHAAGIVGSLPMVYRRLDAEERRSVRPGAVFVWEERSTSSEAAGLGIERWTDGFRWGPSRVRDDFLFYQEKFTKAEGDDVLTKQTYSAWVDLPAGPKKWHLTAYFTVGTIHSMNSVDDLACIRNLTIPEGMYHRSRSGKRKGDGRRDEFYTLPSPIGDPGSLQRRQGSYPLYLPFESQTSFLPVLSRSSVSSRVDPHEDDFHPCKRPRDRAGPASSAETRLDSASAGLAPLSYLQSLQHPRRDAADEMLLRAFASYN